MSTDIRKAPIQCACTSLKMTSRVIGRVYDEALDPSGLNATQYAILVNVERYQPIPQIELARHLGLERTSLYRAVDVLVGHGWLSSTPRGDGVTKLLSLTRDGSARVARAKPLWEETQTRFVRAFGRERWQELLSTLEEIRAHFEP